MNTIESKTNYNDLIVVKVGTNTLTRGTGLGISLDQGSFHNIGNQVEDLYDSDTRIAIVSSGAIAAGLQISDMRRAPEKHETNELQRLACIGQLPLMQAWRRALSKRSLGQLVFTRHELESDEGTELAGVTSTLFRHGDVPVANENDALSHDEITFGDNDTLAAHFAVLLHRSGMFDRTRLVILSDIHGVYAKQNNPKSSLRAIENIDNYRHLENGMSSINGTGGIQSKLAAARIAQGEGIETFIAYGRAENSIAQALAGRIGTHVVARAIAS